MVTVTAIYRYPVKDLSAEKINRVALIPGECLPHDRRFAIALGSLRSAVPGMAVKDQFHHADARRKAGAVADPLRPGKRQSGAP